MLTSSQFAELKALEGSRTWILLETGEEFVCTIFLCTTDEDGSQHVLYDSPEENTFPHKLKEGTFYIAGELVRSFEDARVFDVIHREDWLPSGVEIVYSESAMYTATKWTIFTIICVIYLFLLFLCIVLSFTGLFGIIFLLVAIGLGYLLWRAAINELTSYRKRKSRQGA